MTPKKDQADALCKIKEWYRSRSSSKRMVLSGYAGTGKSTLLSWLQSELGLKDFQIIFTSFTGKATNVLAQKNLRAKTLHRLVYKTTIDKRTGLYYTRIQDEISESLVVVDEASMLSRKLYDDLMKIHGGFKVLFVGDNAQLPPIDSDFNIMEKPDIQLTNVLRQAALNPIIRLASNIRNNKPWKIERVVEGDMGYMPVTEEDVSFSVSRFFVDDVFLCSTNADRVAVNSQIRKEIEDVEGKVSPKPVFKKDSKKLDKVYVSSPRKSSSLLMRDDRVIILDNCPRQNVFNGQLFTIASFRVEDSHSIIINGLESGTGEKRTVKIHPHSFLQEKASNRFNLCEKFALNFKTMGVSCDYAYCLTVHKSQGSEFERVYLQLSDKDRYIWKDLYNRWLYTAVTRASKNLYFVL